MASLATLIYTVFVLSPQVASVEAELRRTEAEAQSAELDVQAKQPGFKIDYLSLDSESFRSRSVTERLVGARIVDNELWPLVVGILDQERNGGEGNACSALMPDPVLESSPAVFDAIQASLDSKPCGAGLEELRFLRLEVTGDLVVQDAAVIGQKASRGNLVVPEPGIGCDGVSYEEPLLAELVSDAATPETSPESFWIGSQAPGDVTLVPLSARVHDNFFVGPSFEFQKLELIDSTGAVVGEFQIRPEHETALVSFDFLDEGARYDESC